jgi:hypothetical protein
VESTPPVTTDPAPVTAPAPVRPAPVRTPAAVATPSATPTPVATETATPTPTPTPTFTPNIAQFIDEDDDLLGDSESAAYVSTETPGADPLAMVTLIVAGALLLGLGGWLLYRRLFLPPVATAKNI